MSNKVTYTYHRIEEDVVKSEVLATGFVLDGQADFLRNNEDTGTGTIRRAPPGNAVAPAIGSFCASGSPDHCGVFMISGHNFNRRKQFKAQNLRSLQSAFLP